MNAEFRPEDQLVCKCGCTLFVTPSLVYKKKSMLVNDDPYLGMIPEIPASFCVKCGEVISDTTKTIEQVKKPMLKIIREGEVE